MERKDFRELVFQRDNYKCVICGKPAVDAHHIVDRSLFEDGGYHIDNGVSICTVHHIEAEETKISCDTLREKAGITKIILPDHFDDEDKYDHWGNIVLSNGTRLKGELFDQLNAQRALKDSLILFLPYYKYQKTFHLSNSPGLTKGDKKLKDDSIFLGRQIVGTIKMDGENTNMYPDYIHARSIDSVGHPSRTWVKALHGSIAHEIPKGYRICGENLFAKHSIHYTHLNSLFNVFSIWNDKNESLSWDETVEYCQLLDLITVPVFYRGIYDPAAITKAFDIYCKESKDSVEGYVIRISGIIPFSKFRKSVAKWVRANHVQSSHNWMQQKVIPNILGE